MYYYNISCSLYCRECNVRFSIEYKNITSDDKYYYIKSYIPIGMRHWNDDDFLSIDLEYFLNKNNLFENDYDISSTDEYDSGDIIYGYSDIYIEKKEKLYIKLRKKAGFGLRIPEFHRFIKTMIRKNKIKKILKR